jgi:hypothetical protein
LATGEVSPIQGSSFSWGEIMEILHRLKYGQSIYRSQMEINHETRTVILTFDEYEEKLCIHRQEIKPQIRKLFTSLRTMRIYLQEALLPIEQKDKAELFELGDKLWNECYEIYEECLTELQKNSCDIKEDNSND